MNQLILASQSPRRKELLDLAGFSYDIQASHLKEEINRNLSLLRTSNGWQNKKQMIFKD